MKQEHYIKVVNDVVHRMERHADIVMNVKQVAEYLACLLEPSANAANANSYPIISMPSIFISANLKWMQHYLTEDRVGIRSLTIWAILERE